MFRIAYLTYFIFIVFNGNILYSQTNTASNTKKQDKNNINNTINAPVEKVKIDFAKSAATKLKNKDINGARKDYEKSLAINPNDGNTQYNYAMLLLNSFDDRINSKKHFESALTILPDDAKKHYVYAFVLKIFFFDNTNSKSHYLTATKIKPSFISNDADKFFKVKR